MQSFSKELRSPYNIWNLGNASLPWIPLNIPGVSLTLTHQGLILGEGSVEDPILRPLSHNLFCCSLFLKISLLLLYGQEVVLSCFVVCASSKRKKKIRLCT